ncbi:MAG: hypothetical protein AAF481_07045 [Acidobacteriota bacterium]
MTNPNVAPAPLTDYIDRITSHLRVGLAERLTAWDKPGHSLAEIGSAEDLARRMLQTVPAPSRWDDLLGPFYSTRQMAELCGGISRQALADRRQRRTLLGLVTADGVVAYPVFQFGEDHRVLPGLPAILQAFDPEHTDDWTVAGWLVAAHGSLGDASVIDWLSGGGNTETALELARDTARRHAR